MYEIKVGQKVRFIPFHDFFRHDSTQERKAKERRGRIVYVNHRHKYFTVEYNYHDTKQRESFKFGDFERDVMPFG